ncbi:toprim domain-containing protein [Enterococcus innesii]|uniref:toprim domain-containing protein n=1 Tax=Enterococcus innesii TaxID=2839759 RepID=UPI003B5955E5
MITVNNVNLAVDYCEELEPYLDKFSRYAIRDNKLQSCSPFREDRNPSFAVNLDNGTWIDSGATGEFHKGHFITLLSFLREESAEDTCDYLHNVYSPLLQDVSDLHLDLSYLEKPKTDELKVFTAEELQKFAFRHSYLEQRGISEEVQQLFRVGYDPVRKAVALCWTNQSGEIVNIKFRSINTKQFWYADGQRIKNHVYGYSIFQKAPSDVLAIVESEIDCLRLWTEGIASVALGSAHLSQPQTKILFNSGVSEIVVATDNDGAGERCAKQIEETFVGTFNISRFNFNDSNAKDVSDLTTSEIVLGFESRKVISLCNAIKI